MSDHHQALIDAMLEHAGNADMLDELAAMADDAEDVDEVPVDDGMGEPGDAATVASADRVKRYLRDSVLAVMNRRLKAEPADQQDTDATTTKTFNEADHPRDDHGRFVSADELEEAKTDPEAAAKLRERVTDPEQLAKLEEHIGKEDESTDEPEEKPEWDGTIDADRVDEDRSTYAYSVATWDYVDEDGRVYPQQINLLHGVYDVDPDDPDSEQVDVYRWESRDENGVSDQGKWTTDEDQAREDGKEHAERNHTEPPEDEDEEEAEDGGDSEETDEDEDNDEDAPPPLPDKSSPPKKSKANAGPAPDVDALKADAMVRELLPKANAAEDVDEVYVSLASVLGAPDDAEVEIVHVGDYSTLFGDDLPMPGARGIRVNIKHEKMDRVSRFIGFDADGKRFIKNEIIEIKEKYQGEGLGSEIFGNQVENAVDEGFDYITTHAAGEAGSSMNGYYTWPRFGYNQSVKSIKKHNPKLAKRIASKFPDAKSVRDIMKTSEGRNWWKANGGDLHDARFDLGENSWSRYILASYLNERAKKKEA